jgi:hypothetical protein
MSKYAYDDIGRFLMLYPCTRRMTPQEVIDWAKDIASDSDAEGFDLNVPESCADFLQDEGHATFAGA